MSYFEFPHTRTYDSDLGWIIKTMHEYGDIIHALNEWMAKNTPKIDDLYAFMDGVINGDLPDGMKRGLFAWAEENLYNLVGDMINLVIFNITDDGYFVAYIPESWEEIQFATTGLDVIIPEQPEYGHLVLSYEASNNAF